MPFSAPWSWFFGAVLLFGSGAWLGKAQEQDACAVFKEAGGRFSLSRFQLWLWTVLLLPAIAVQAGILSCPHFLYHGLPQSLPSG